MKKTIGARSSLVVNKLSVIWEIILIYDWELIPMNFEK